MKNTVSIIVPIYNVEKYIKKCVDSLLKQSYKDIQIYLVDDGSPDNSGKICDELSKKDNRIIVVHKENGGYGSVLQYCISIINTKYFIICDPDDWLEEKCIEKLVNKMEKYDLDICIGEKYLVYNDNDEIKYIGSNKGKKLEANMIFEGNNINKLVYLDVSPHSKMFKTNICKNILFPNKVSYTDKILFYVSLDNASKVMYIDEPLSYYLIDRPGNTATEKSIKLLNNELIVTNSLLEQLSNKSSSSCAYLALAIQYRYLLGLYYYFNNKEYKNEINNIYNDIYINKKIFNKYYSFVSKKDKLLIILTFHKITKWIINLLICIKNTKNRC